MQSNHRLRGSGSTVVTMTSKVNGKTEISTPCRSETPENIETKIGVNDYVMDPYNHANFCRNRSKGVCSPYWWNIAYLWLCVPFLSFPFFLVVAYSKDGWTHIHDVYLKRRRFAQGFAFWGSRWRKIMFGGQNPPKTQILGAGIGILSQTCKIFKWPYLGKYSSDLNEILTQASDHERGFVGGPGGWSRVAKYQFKMAAAAILDFWTNHNNSAIYWATVMKFYTDIPSHNPKGTKWQKWSPEVNSRWRRPPSWILLNGHNSAIFQPICTKFHTETENGVP